MSSDDTRRRMEYQAVGGALAQLDAKNPQAAQLIAGLVTVIIAEAERSSRFASALTGVVDALRPVDIALDGAPVEAPRKRAAAPKKQVTRQPGAFDPFVVYREGGGQELSARLGELTLDQLRDIIAEQELDTRKETSRKRKPEVLVSWIVERVEASENKGSVFR
ncbi:hypothetical protein [Gordonia alkanivorans]|uniref:hypothetical protein n=1 Tax=Gordonia alkanivorans TaxID=84096 RepID=UPI000FDF43AA|nr:hypothetical protein [Gordonia alkanivorans]AZZ81229.1 hypothetical protein C5O27_09305 [Gordonia alkanivorans]MDH3019519.1 hypothetical protein [Gordonia alkanivorans]MDJ0007872.1 hypothetical protein [Gordonia alkanivorans]MDJ0096505.1 hypothetical protein [Gordonia alkanivorans]MDJ0493182.1 hypothetical protein [Gordonia alkanivorans]